MSEPLPPYRVRAVNTSAHSENKIHDDAVARQLGFRGGLVPGVTVYAYLTHPLVETLGRAWIGRGTATLRLARPVFEGEEVTVTGAITGREGAAVTATVTACTEASGPCATLAVSLPAGLPTPVNRTLYREAALPAERPEATREHLASLDVLGTPLVAYDEARAAEYLAGIADTLPIYRGTGALVHPAFYLHQANRALSQNVRVGPWIHAGSAVRHLDTAAVGETLATRGRVRSLYEKKGREFVELDLLITAGPRSRPVAHVLHTAIYRLPVPAG